MTTGPAVQPFGSLGATTARATGDPHVGPVVDETWEFEGGTAWVFYAEGHTELVKPVILSDGFSMGPSNLFLFWEGLEHGEYPFVRELGSRGYDLIILGYAERSASILKNAEVAISCINRAKDQRADKSDLMAVGGFSMGGLVTRYALAKMEHEGSNHEVGTYISYDSPHRGAWIPLSLQGLAHFLAPISDGMKNMINSEAATELMWRHKESIAAPAVEHENRRIFLAKLREYGWWPTGPLNPNGIRKIGVANGSGTGEPNGVPAGELALEITGGLFNNTDLYLQDDTENQLVAYLKALLQPAKEVRTPSLPELDGAPGGTLESFGIAADELNGAGQPATAHYRSIAFVPAVSAVAIRDIDTHEDLYADISAIPSQESELDAFLCASQNEEHTLMTEELGGWIIDQLELNK
ncbi:esterase/lipase family protein [Streptomyces sp. RKAG337]|uniref:esterase/lipase family protein n=1 Tax=Streptomyces sp. RKAG337 TaxID=2893404 RepID=UPI00203468EC|nr:hypothetical protein [Streptomyces sp. RKAG337]MCM2428496.1 hypothetical protein [Streptomyces sp. RKAG337]